MNDMQEYIGTQRVKLRSRDSVGTTIEFPDSQSIGYIYNHDFKKRFKSLTSGEMDFSMAMYWLLHGDGRRVGRKSVKGESFGRASEGVGRDILLRYCADGSARSCVFSFKEMFAKDWYVMDWPK